MSRTLTRAFFVLLIALFAMGAIPAARAAAPATTQSAPPANARDLLSYGTDQNYWSADVVPVSYGREIVFHTIVRKRDAGTPWREIADFAAPTVSLGHRASELLIVTPSGQWMIASEGGVRTGTPLPGGANVLALAGDGDDIWSVGGAAAGKLITPATESTTGPATTTTAAPTTATAASTVPATAPSLPPHELGLFRLHHGIWQEQAVLPAGLGRDDIKALSLAMIDGRLMLAVAARELAVRVYAYHDDKWDDGEDVAAFGQRGEIRLMTLDGRPALWVVDATAPTFGDLFIRNEGWGKPIKLEMSDRLKSFDAISLTVALGRLRLLASDGTGRLAEQLYNADGTLVGQAVEGVTSPRGSEERLANALQVLVMVILLAWMIGSVRQRPAMQEALKHLEQLQLAPHGRRLLGGVIDLLPLVVSLVVAEQILLQSGQPVAARLTFRSPEFAWLMAGVGLYLLLTTVFEMVLGRSLGKLVTGTRVASLNGSRPPASSVLLRNLLRIVDLLLLLFPLSFIFFSPLRQRIGDMAGGTLVVLNSAPMPLEPPADPPQDPSV